MLKELKIKNYVLIKELEISPKKTLNTITGETGAGKSIMLGAIGLLLGNRADTKVLLDESTKCIIEGEFDIRNYNLEHIFEEEDVDFEEQTVIRREISPSGKSRAFVNDTPVRLETLKRLGENLIDIHSQHQTLLLQKANFQLKVVDAVAQNKSLFQEFSKEFRIYKRLQTELSDMKETLLEGKKDHDYRLFLLNELQEVGLENNEEALLEKEQELFNNQEDIKNALGHADQVLNGGELSTLEMMREALSGLNKIQSFSEDYSKLYERLDSVFQELSDICTDLQQKNEELEFDEERSRTVADRLNIINSLLKKHNVSTADELIKIEQDLSSSLNEVENLDDRIVELENALKDQFIKVDQLATELSDSRKAVFDKISTSICKSLSVLGMPNATLALESNHVELNSYGKDDLNFLFSANKGGKLDRLKNAASGGEFSRLMFSLKYLIADKTAMPTIIFDEIDAGISGEVAIKIATMMSKMSTNHQIFTITHLPQVAAKGDFQYFVYKDDDDEKTYSSIKLLTDKERVLELAKMIGGEKPSESALLSAQEMLV